MLLRERMVELEATLQNLREKSRAKSKTSMPDEGSELHLALQENKLLRERILEQMSVIQSLRSLMSETDLNLVCRPQMYSLRL